ncbi:dihydrodipicolinate synthase family protein [Oceanithermus sp.]
MIVPALITPMDRSGRPDAGALQEIIDRLEPSVDGFLVLGSTGEAVTLAPEERRELLEGLKVRKPFWVGVGDESLPLARRHAEAAVAAGADYLLAMPPRFYDRAMTREAFATYFHGLAEVGEVWIYHVPMFTKTDFPLEIIRELAAHPRITGMKDSSGDVNRLIYYRAHVPGFTVFSGNGLNLAAAVASGARGAILAVGNVAPRLFSAVMDQQRNNGEVEQELAALAYDTAVLFGKGGAVLIKQALRFLGLPAGYPRPPFPPESPYWLEAERLLGRLKEEGWLL